jgi:hypothetical protein
MKQYIFLPIALVATLAALLFSSCTVSINTPTEAIEPGEMTKETRKLEEPFNILTASGAIDVEFITSDSSYIEIEAGENVLPHIKTEVNNMKLSIQLDNAGGRPFYSSDSRTFHFQLNDGTIGGTDIKVKVFAPSLEEVRTAGSVDFIADSLRTTEMFKVNTAGNSDITIQHVNCDNAEIKMAGQSDVKIGNITCKNIKIGSAGNSDLNLKINGANNTEVSIAGHSDADITFNKCNRAGINIAGASDLTLKGTLNILDKHVAGVCSINTDGLKLTNKSEE